MRREGLLASASRQTGFRHPAAVKVSTLLLTDRRCKKSLAVANKPQRVRRSERRSAIRRLTHDEARRIAGDWTGVSISRQIGCLLARIAFSEAQRRAGKATS